MKLLLFLVLALPTAAATSFDATVEDAQGDVVTFSHDPAPYPSADILRASSELVDGSVWQRVEMAARPTAPEDTILVRTWFRNSTNGSFYSLDLEVDGSAPDPAARFKPVLRNGSFDDALAIPARYGLDNATWIFEFNASFLGSAECFTLHVTAVHTPKRALQGFDSVAENGDCETGVEPMGDAMPPPVEFNLPSPSAPAPTTPSVDPPGTNVPAPGIAALVGAVLIGGAIRRKA